MKTLRDILKERDIKYNVMAKALGIHPNNIGRYDNLKERTLEELKIISTVIGEDISNLIEITSKQAKSSKVATVGELMKIYDGHQSDVKKLLGKDYADVTLASLTKDQEEKLAVALHANFDDMITGIEALKRETSGKLVPLFDARAAAGPEGVSVVPVYKEGWINIGDLLKDSESAMYVYGNSMLPGYPSGCVIGLKEKKTSLIDTGNVYVIETEDDRFFKRLYYNADQTAFRCVSDNKIKHTEGDLTGEWFYQTFEIPFTDVKRLFAVTGLIKRNRHL